MLVILILENAINYNSIEEAKEMILKGRMLTKDTGVKTLSKFQLFNEGDIVNPEHKEFCLKRMLDFPKAEALFKYGQSIGQEVFFSCMFPLAVEWCRYIGVNYYKIRYYDRYDKDLCAMVLASEKTLFISVDELYKWGDNVKPLFCVPKYPAKKEDYWNYNIRYYRGISDHTPDLELLENALAEDLGVIEYFERHVCLTKEGCLEAEWASTFEELEEVIKV